MASNPLAEDGTRWWWWAFYVNISQSWVYWVVVHRPQIARSQRTVRSTLPFQAHRSVVTSQTLVTSQTIYFRYRPGNRDLIPWGKVDISANFWTSLNFNIACRSNRESLNPDIWNCGGAKIVNSRHRPDSNCHTTTKQIPLRRLILERSIYWRLMD